MKLLVSKGSVVNGSGVLISAARGKRVEMVRFLLAEGGDINETDSEGSTPLHWAVFAPPPLSTMYRVKKLRPFIGNGITITPTPKPNQVQELVKLLIRHGADVNRTDNSGRTPLACTRSVRVARILTEAGAKVTGTSARLRPSKRHPTRRLAK